MSTQSAGAAARISGSKGSHRHLGLDVRMRIVVLDREVLITEAEDLVCLRIDSHFRQRPRRARQLQPRLLDMIHVKMRVVEGVHELPGLIAGNLRYHHCKQRIGGDVERHSEKYVSRALPELAGQ